MERSGVKLKQLFKGLPVQILGNKDRVVNGICSNSQRVSPGNLFVAKKGLTHDGSQFIPEAVAAGAVAVLTDFCDPFLERAVQVIHPDVPAIEAEIALRFYRYTESALPLIGVTGTNGKTTCAYLIKQLLGGLNVPCGLIGTIECDTGRSTRPSTKTTPDLIETHRLLAEMRAHGCKAAVMEVSSHALEQGRVRGLPFDTAVFTNLTLDHLDYHRTMERYAAAKAKLFTAVRRRAIVNVDSPWASQVAATCSAPLLTYGIEHDADLSASGIALSPGGTQCFVRFHGETRPFATSLIGRFNVYNCLAAIGVGLARGFSLGECVEALRAFKKVPGRLERVAVSNGVHVFVDYAHTDDALRNVLEVLNEIKRGRVLTVFGCGGDRDRSKRPKMAEAAQKLSDFTIVTTDNPRSEDPDAILKQIIAGFRDAADWVVEPDREAAIHRAMRMAAPGDIVLIAGKGHETTQIFAHQTVPFDDRLIAASAG
jgi:UDP-N-acetylmuramoyl-L-alanyl-D-glutamate--2,6-diaminopimelate ligase